MRRGFTLIELLVVISIIALLIAGEGKQAKLRFPLKPYEDKRLTFEALRGLQKIRGGPEAPLEFRAAAVFQAVQGADAVEVGIIRKSEKGYEPVTRPQSS